MGRIESAKDTVKRTLSETNSPAQRSQEENLDARGRRPVRQHGGLPCPRPSWSVSCLPLFPHRDSAEAAPHSRCGRVASPMLSATLQHATCEATRSSGRLNRALKVIRQLSPDWTGLAWGDPHRNVARDCVLLRLITPERRDAARSPITSTTDPCIRRRTPFDQPSAAHAMRLRRANVVTFLPS